MSIKADPELVDAAIWSHKREFLTLPTIQWLADEYECAPSTIRRHLRTLARSATAVRRADVRAILGSRNPLNVSEPT